MARQKSFIRLCAMLLIAVLLPAAGAFGSAPVDFQKQDGRMAITIDRRPFAVYMWRDPKILRPYFAHLHAPGGAQVTRNLPPIEGTDPTDHDTMHPGLWLAFGDISGNDFWRNKGTVEHVEFVEQPTVVERGSCFAVRNRYRVGDKTICEEVCRIHITAQIDGYLIDWESTFSAPADFYFGDQEEMGLGFRTATPLAAKQGGQIVNSDGSKNEKQVWGKPAPWCDYSGTIDDRQVGMMLMSDPQNFRPAWFHARDYGLLVANPFGENAFTKGPKSKIEVKAGQSLRLHFGVLIHAGSFDRPAAYAAWLRDFGGVK